MQHSHFNRRWLLILSPVILLFTLSSFIAGGESFSIFLNKQLIFTQHVSQQSVPLNKLPLTKANYNDQLIVYYNHCGAAAKGRSIVIKDDKKILKEWKFANAAKSNTNGMAIPVKDILNLQKNHSSLKLYYFSTEHLPQGRMLASVDVDAKDIAKH